MKLKPLIPLAITLLFLPTITFATNICDTDFGLLVNNTTAMSFLTNGTYQYTNTSSNVTFTIYLSCQPMISNFQIPNISWSVNEPTGTVDLPINLTALDAINITIIGNSIFDRKELFISSDFTVQLDYSLDKCANSSGKFNIYMNGKKHIFNYTLYAKDINLPRISNLLYPLEVKSGQAYTIFLTAYDNWAVKNVSLITSKSYNETNGTWSYDRVIMSSIGSNRYSIDRVAYEYGAMEYEIELFDSVENVVRRNFSFQVLPKGELSFASLNMPALRIGESYEHELFSTKEAMEIRLKITELNWTYKGKTYYEPNATNVTNETVAYFPDVMIRATELRDVNKGILYSFNNNKISLYIISEKKGRLTGKIEFDMPIDYRVMNNVSKFDVEFKDYTILPSHELELGGRVAKCNLTDDLKNYRCYTEFPSTIKLKNVGMIVSEFDIDALESKWRATVALKEEVIKNITTYSVIYIIVICALSGVLVFVWFRHFSGVKIKY